jgi:hypothetical protein
MTPIDEKDLEEGDSRAATTPSSPAEELPDPFDPARLALKGNPADAIAVKRVLAHVPVRKPGRQEFVRTHPDPAFRILMAILELRAEREIFGVLPEVAAAIPGETRPVLLTTSMNRQGDAFLWPVPVPTGDGRELAWHETAREAAVLGEKVWVRMIANMGVGAYDIYAAAAEIPEPNWSDHTLQDLLRVAFGNDRLIQTVDHPVVRRLRGLA